LFVWCCLLGRCCSFFYRDGALFLVPPLCLLLSLIPHVKNSAVTSRSVANVVLDKLNNKGHFALWLMMVDMLWSYSFITSLRMASASEMAGQAPSSQAGRWVGCHHEALQKILLVPRIYNVEPRPIHYLLSQSFSPRRAGPVSRSLCSEVRWYRERSSVANSQLPPSP
jgi:hypothetical protein